VANFHELMIFRELSQIQLSKKFKKNDFRCNHLNILDSICVKSIIFAHIIFRIKTQKTMKYKFLTTFLLTTLATITVIILASFASGDNGETGNQRANTPGVVTFTATTSSAGGNYAPKHVLAIWVEKDGVFVKTRKAMANSRKQYLYMWKAASNYNVVDAITGPTLNSHQTHTVTWDCKDLSGNVVVDGDYTIILEFTDKHAQGPFIEVTFNKGTEPVTMNPANQTYIKNISLTYSPMAANFNANVTQVCTAESVVFTDNSTGATSWAWNFGAGATPATATTQGPHNVSYSNPGSKTVSLTINGAVTETKTNYITVFPDPIAGFNYQKSDLTVTFTNTSQNANSYLWDFGDGNTSTETNPFHTYLTGGSYVVNLTSASSTCGDDVTSQTIFLETAAANFSANVTQVCTAQGVIFTDNSTAATSWAWNFGAGASPATATTQGPHTVNYSTSGSKTVSLTINGSVTETKTNYITVYPEPVAGFSWSQAGLIISFSNNSLNAVSYLWDFGDGNTSTETNPVHTYSSDGTYLVSLTSTSEICGNDVFTETLVLNTIGISENESTTTFQVFPNPSNGNFSLISQELLKNATLKLYNLQGRLVFERTIEVIGKEGAVFFTDETLTSGMYFLDVSTDQKSFRKKVFIK
jgi:PKD repeat protein